MLLSIPDSRFPLFLQLIDSGEHSGASAERRGADEFLRGKSESGREKGGKGREGRRERGRRERGEKKTGKREA
jgi:hypothetical protein